jgi:hypothetical protein
MVFGSSFVLCTQYLSLATSSTQGSQQFQRDKGSTITYKYRVYLGENCTRFGGGGSLIHPLNTIKANRSAKNTMSDYSGSKANSGRDDHSISSRKPGRFSIRNPFKRTEKRKSEQLSQWNSDVERREWEQANETQGSSRQYSLTGGTAPSGTYGSPFSLNQQGQTLNPSYQSSTAPYDNTNYSNSQTYWPHSNLALTNSPNPSNAAGASHLASSPGVAMAVVRTSQGQTKVAAEMTKDAWFQPNNPWGIPIDVNKVGSNYKPDEKAPGWHPKTVAKIENSKVWETISTYLDMGPNTTCKNGISLYLPSPAWGPCADHLDLHNEYSTAFKTTFQAQSWNKGKVVDWRMIDKALERGDTNREYVQRVNYPHSETQLSYCAVDESEAFNAEDTKLLDKRTQKSDPDTIQAKFELCEL